MQKICRQFLPETGLFLVIFSMRKFKGLGKICGRSILKPSKYAPNVS